jgi:hypothetical protein
MKTPALRTAVPSLAVLALLLAGCGSSSGTGATSPATASASTTRAASATTSAPPPAVDQLAAAEHPSAGQFPAVRGRTLQQVANTVQSSAELGAATGTFTPGTRRFAFGLTDKSGAFIYAPTALYVAATPNSRASGPFLAPADPMTVAPQYRSEQNAGPGGIKAIYAANVPLPRKGTFAVLSVTLGPHGLIGSPGEIAVAQSSPIPDVGGHPPAIATDTLATVGGNVSLLTTRVPPEKMHAVSFKDVLGKRPIALLISTPQLCTSKVCGPVTDIVVQLQHTFGDKLAFIHQEVYVDNEPSKGLRPQLKALHLQTEPWLFTINSRGVIAARLEGSFGVNAATKALEAALR